MTFLFIAPNGEYSGVGFCLAYSLLIAPPPRPGVNIFGQLGHFWTSSTNLDNHKICCKKPSKRMSKIFQIYPKKLKNFQKSPKLLTLGLGR